jgi:hypothetical protein
MESRTAYPTDQILEHVGICVGVLKGYVLAFESHHCVVPVIQ